MTPASPVSPPSCPPVVAALSFPTHPSPTETGLLPAVKRISWGAIFAGMVLAIVLQLALSLLGLGIGLGTIDPLTEQNPVAGIGTGAAIWWVVTMLASIYLGATVAGRLAGMPRPTDGLLHGLLTWAMVTLLTFYLLTTAVGRLVGGVTSVVSSTLSGIGSGIAAVAPQAGQAIEQELANQGIDLSDLKQQARLLLRQTGKAQLNPENLADEARAAGRNVQAGARQSAANPQAADDNFDDVIDRLASRAENIGNAADRTAAVNVVMQRSGKSRAESEQIVDNWIATAKQAQAKYTGLKNQAAQQAREAGDAAAEALSKTALLAALGLGLGAAAAAVGGWLATPPRELTTPPVSE